MTVPPTNWLAIVTELARRFAAGDGAGAAALLHKQVRIQQPESLPHGGWHEGQAGLAAMGATFGEHWTRVISDPRIINGGETVVQVTTQAWTASSRALAMPPPAHWG